MPDSGMPDAGEFDLSQMELLHLLRLKGTATAAQLATATTQPVDELEAALAVLAEAGWVRAWPGEPKRWQQTRLGREHGQNQLAEALDAAGVRPATEQQYAAFLPLNREFLELCADWQVRVVGGVRRPNDHIDERYDRAVIRRLVLVDSRIQPLVAELANNVERFGSYAERFGNALARVESGLQDWFTKPGVDSYHTVWFELHEDLLATLGYERSQEHS